MSLGQDGPPTRTRLPESPGGSGVPARRPARSSRSLVTVVGVVVLLIAAIAFVNRGGDHGGGTAGSGNGDRAAGGGTAPQPTAATGTRPVDGKSAGIPTGYSRTDQGAQSAAANYAVALGSDGMFAPDRRATIVDTVYAPDVAAAQRRDLDGVYSDPAFLGRIGLGDNGAPPDGMTFVSRTTPVGTKLDSLSGDSAVVEVWYSSLFGLAGEGSTNPVSESWYTNTFRLKWVGGDWKIVDFEQKDGPTPVGRDQTASSADEMSDAVNGFGGFTYAR
ncbi:hypothetical protein [Streptomyces sp. MI02-7b]|uniref:hypothetical protein n=1 Tax=Streptomyces sp. MI02-7b TaxID=462941 RepID=UPI0029A5AE0D|nr:hypothetical protein [Streptomyces sp. MI02-7b]MDX3076451.1 hypothetical protein [Streptomyces sp. MI02-7b]